MVQETIAQLEQEFGAEAIRVGEFRDNVRVTVPAKSVLDVLQALKEKHGFDMLVDLTAVDYLYYPDATDRYAVVYLLLNVASGERLIVKTMLNDNHLRLPSVVPLWTGADWMEREAYDMYGIRFDGHPNLMRILMPQEFSAHPLRKDYPLRGRGERHNFPVITRAES
jgi:NADH-quinone oxidoreductase subunit C